MNRSEKILSGIDLKNQIGMEIGPLNRPFVKKSDGPILYVDYLDGPALREKYKTDPNVDVTKIVDVDVVCNQNELVAQVGEARVDYILASHVIEHVPDLVAWLHALRIVLREDGEIRLAVPDRRFTFDYLRAESRLCDVVDAYLRKATAPTPHAVLDFCYYAVAVDVTAAWRGMIDATKLIKTHTPHGALFVARDALERGTYHDVHCWAFTPWSLSVLFEELATLGLMQFACASFHDTEENEIEFFIKLKPCKDENEIVDSWRKMRKGLNPPPAKSDTKREVELASRVLELELQLAARSTSRLLSGFGRSLRKAFVKLSSRQK